MQYPARAAGLQCTIQQMVHPTSISSCAGLVPGIHGNRASGASIRGWPGQARPTPTMTMNFYHMCLNASVLNLTFVGSNRHNQSRHAGEGRYPWLEWAPAFAGVTRRGMAGILGFRGAN